ncbi:LuxR C-terminal-related transcriptional regulator [Microseira sp. BLCC-F43]|jgi:DNA-binding CsgD family transcriptional regulator|uniref:helix-turn-helix transcriptional regulator n=1 Tax=Microseira sp. BLCC-F43 TaxID=3153602 RepID=UPI0035B94636
MTVHTLPIASEGTWILNSRWDRHNFNEEVSQPKPATFDWSWQILAESLREGLMIISRNVKPVYVNRQAKELCQTLAENDPSWAGLPEVVSEICHKLIKNGNGSDQPVILECQAAGGQTIRVRASWLNSYASDDSRGTGRAQYILVFLENRNEILQEELQFEQQKYQFTDREMEIWSLLRQDYSYQEIAATLHISLNTVKTHVKNIYAKKRWNQGGEKNLVS